MNEQENSSQNLFNTHIKKLREHKKLTVAALATELGIHRNTQINYETNRDPRIEYLLKFSDVMKISFWQLVRQRVRFSDSPQPLIDKALNALGPFGQNNHDHQGIQAATTTYDIKKQINNMLLNDIQLHDINGGAFTSTLEQIAYQFQAHENVRTYRQQGESMAPKICEGDLVIVDINDKEIIDGQIYLVNFDQQMMARRIQIGPNQQIIISSENSQYAPVTLEYEQKDRINIIGKMTFYIGKIH